MFVCSTKFNRRIIASIAADCNELGRLQLIQHVSQIGFTDTHKTTTTIQSERLPTTKRARTERHFDRRLLLHQHQQRLQFDRLSRRQHTSDFGRQLVLSSGDESTKSDKCRRRRRRTKCVRCAALRPVVIRSMSTRPVRGSIAAVCIAANSSRWASSTSLLSTCDASRMRANASDNRTNDSSCKEDTRFENISKGEMNANLTWRGGDGARRSARSSHLRTRSTKSLTLNRKNAQKT